MEMLFVLCSRDQDTRQTQRNALSKLRVIIAAEFSSWAAGVGYKGRILISGMENRRGKDEF